MKQDNFIFALGGQHHLLEGLLKKTGFIQGQCIQRTFPDGETYLRLLSDVKQSRCFVLADLKNPNENILPLYFLVSQLKEMAAKKIILITPYLPYMRQDTLFNEGECVTSRFFARFISSFVDELITIDPHLHRFHQLSEIYPIPAMSLSAANLIGEWIKKNISRPFILGPDSESDQWVKKVADKDGIPYLVLNKQRLGDKTVVISKADLSPYSGYIPVIVDDIISTGHTLIQTAQQILGLGFKKIMCLCIHAVFSGDANEEIKRFQNLDIITTNTLFHESNRVDVSELISDHLKNYVE